MARLLTAAGGLAFVAACALASILTRSN